MTESYPRFHHVDSLICRIVEPLLLKIYFRNPREKTLIACLRISCAKCLRQAISAANVRNVDKKEGTRH
jgi:hypothetical protein